MDRCCLLFAHAFVLALVASGCGPATRADRERDATRAVKTQIARELDALNRAARDLQAAAPVPDADGWNATTDAAAVIRMREAWRRARAAYERIEGAIAVLFPEIDRSTDERYDGFIAEEADTNLFDGQGVTGVHAIERILWADAHPESVVRFESSLERYVPASFPANEQQARDFRDGLLQRLIDDTARMQREFAPLALDAAAAFRGVIGSMAEQREKVDLAATGEDESRYAQYTLADMRANLAGARDTFAIFRPWLVAEGREDLARAIDDRLTALQARYDALPGDAVPPVPATWNPDNPSAADLATDYGRLRTALVEESDPMRADSLVSLMNQAAGAMGIPELPQ